MTTFLLAGLLTASCALAQAPADPPLLIQVIQSMGSDGSGARRYSNANATPPVFGMRSITGEPETWLIEAHYSFAGIEELDKAIAAAAVESRPGDRTLIALYRPGWSYRPDLAIRAFAKARYFHVSEYRIRPGTETEFGELVRQRRSGFDRMNLDRPDIAYHVISGAPAETYLFLAPLASLKVLDEALDRAAVDAPRAANKGLAEIEVNRRHLLFRTDPRISRIPE